jgi:hypothetical protein
MEKMFFKMVDSMCEDTMVYKSKNGDLWLVNPKTKQWIITYHPPTNYAWWNFELFDTVYTYLSMDIFNNREPIKNWIQTRLDVEVGLCEPDMLPGEYDWSDDFNPEKVISGGEVFNF